MKNGGVGIDRMIVGNAILLIVAVIYCTLLCAIIDIFIDWRAAGGVFRWVYASG